MTSKVTYSGHLNTESIHIQSGAIIYTDAPVDNNGKGENFSPTDLVVNALANCMLTIIGMAAKTHGFIIDGTQAEVTKVMTANPRRIHQIVVNIKMNGQESYSEKEQKIIENAAKTCPVALSLHPDIEQLVTFEW